MANNNKLTYKEIAQKLNKTEQAIYQIIKRNQEFYYKYITHINKTKALTEEGFNLLKNNAHKEYIKRNWNVKQNANVERLKAELKEKDQKIEALQTDLINTQKELISTNKLLAEKQEQLYLETQKTERLLAGDRLKAENLNDTQDKAKPSFKERWRRFWAN